MKRQQKPLAILAIRVATEEPVTVAVLDTRVVAATMTFPVPAGSVRLGLHFICELNAKAAKQKQVGKLYNNSGDYEKINM